jgi:hypothetical protein
MGCRIGIWVGLLAGLVLAQPLPQSRVVAGVKVSYVRASLQEYRLEVVMAANRIAATAPLASMASRSAAACVINGTFLAAYKGQTQEPYGTLVWAGRVLHLGSVGTRLDILPDGSLRMARDGLGVQGGIDGQWGYPHNWYAYNFNRTPTPGSSYAYIYTPERGSTLGFKAGLAVVVAQGRVVSVAFGRDASIPSGGWVLALGGREVQVLGKKFRKGQQLEYRVVDQEQVPLEVSYSLGAGPQLIRAGRVVLDSTGEGFDQYNITHGKATRSVVATTARGEVILAILPGATLSETARALLALGATEAMNLDGGASSGLYCGGKYIVGPGRQVANGLALKQR